MIWFYVAIILLAGILAPTQAGINAILSTYLRSNVLAALVSFAVGTIGLFVYALVLRISWPLGGAIQRVPWWAWFGGLFGAFLVTATITAAPKLGAATMIGFFIAGQMLASLILDHYGLLGFPLHPMNAWRILGVIFLTMGVILIKKF